MKIFLLPLFSVLIAITTATPISFNGSLLFLFPISIIVYPLFHKSDIKLPDVQSLPDKRAICFPKRGTTFSPLFLLLLPVSLLSFLVNQLSILFANLNRAGTKYISSMFNFQGMLQPKL